MIQIEIPGLQNLVIENLLLDLNGTLALDGKVSPVIAGKVKILTRKINIFIVSADTMNTASAVSSALGIELIRISGNEAEEKARVLRKLGPGKTAAMGNGFNDSVMVKESALGICVIGKEGASPVTMMASDIVVLSFDYALDLFLKPKRLIATLRK